MTRETQQSLALFMAVIHFSFYMTSQMFAADYAAGGSPITAETYGAKIYEIPAVFWIAVQMNASILGVAGCLCVAASKKYTRLGALIGFMGSCGILALFGLFGWMADAQSHGAVLRYICWGPGLVIPAACGVLLGRIFWWGENYERIV